MKKTLKKVLKVLLVFLIIWIIAIESGIILRQYQAYCVSRSVVNGLEIPKPEDHKKVWQNRQSDIEGMTLWDKYKAGLLINNGSDSDGDGLTDKEEIEIYGSDPLKVSTADDLYLDSYKVEHNISPYGFSHKGYGYRSGYQI